MPRTAKRTQPPAAPQDQGYGQRGEQIAAQRAMPLPDNQGIDPAQAGQPMANPGQPPVEVPAPGSPGNLQTPQDLLGMLQAQQPPPAGGLGRPTDRPAEPVTAGLNTPPPPQSTNRAADTLDLIATVSGDDRFRALAQRARMM